MAKKSIAREFTQNLLTSVLILGVATGLLWILQTQLVFNEFANHIGKEAEDEAAKRAADRVTAAYQEIEYTEIHLQELIKARVQSQVEDGITRIQQVLRKNTGISAQKAKQLAADELRNDRFFDGRGYYFIDTFEGEVVLFPYRPELEGSNIIDVVDARGQKTVVQEILIVKEAGKGFVTGYWPRPQDPDSEGRLKISYVKQIEPYEWYLGTGDYYDDYKADALKGLLDRYSTAADANGVHLFILDREGNPLIPRGAGDATDQLMDGEQWESVTQAEREYANTKPLGYGYLRTFKDADGTVKTAQVYLKMMPQWGIIVGAEVLVESPAPYPSKTQMFTAALQVVAVVSLMYMIFVIVLRNQAHKLRNDFIAFMAFFKQAAKGDVLIEVSDLQMKEFVSMANLANQMVIKSREANEALKESNEQLELQVKNRTKELEDSLLILESTQEQLIQNEKLSLLGNLVAEISHEINVPVGIARSLNSDLQELLTSVSGSLSKGNHSTIEQQALIARMEEDVTMTEANLKRVIELVTSFRDVSVDQCSGKSRAFNLCSYLEEIALSLSYRLKKGNHHVEIICENGIEVVGYPGALSQVLTNLMMNSLQHGFKNRVGGNITLEAISGSDRVLLLYKDDGCGISPRDIGKIYEPFFTTDSENGGSGLGLSIVHQLVTEKLCGTINLTSKEGRGVLVQIEFPKNLKNRGD